MFIHKLSFVLLLLFSATAINAEMEQGPKLGKPASEQLINTWDISIFPDGTGLPVGQGTVAEGKALYKTQCSICHGPAGIGGTAEELSGGEQGLTGEYPDKTIGTYWPYATTLFDFINRAMPLMAPGSLSDNETYALTAYLLHINKVIPADATLSNKNLHEVVMPNRDGMIWVYPNLNVKPDAVTTK